MAVHRSSDCFSHDFQEPGVNDPSGAAPGLAWIVVRAPELTPDTIKNAMIHGDFYASTDVEKIAKPMRSTSPSRSTPPLWRPLSNSFHRQEWPGAAGERRGTATYSIHGGELYIRAKDYRLERKDGLDAAVFVTQK